MFNLNPEAKVGLFVFAGIVLLVLMSMWLGGLNLGKDEGILIYVNFPNAAGLDMNASVAVAGVEVGRVESIVLEENKAKLGVRVYPNVNIGRDFTAVLKNKGLLGEKYVELLPGMVGSVPLQEGEELTRVATFTDLDKLVTVLADVATDIKTVTEALKMSMGGEGGATSIQNIIVSIEGLVNDLNNVVGGNSEHINSIMSNLDVMVADITRDGPGLLKSFHEVSENLNNVVVENSGGIAEVIENMRFATRRMEEAMVNI
ncbi:MAG: MCE family protein, partial [bacterium]|nr:MCE family protein [bacterium]